MSASLYFLVIPAGVITVSAFVVTRQEDSFTRTSRTRDIQEVKRHVVPGGQSAKPKPSDGEIPRTAAAPPLGREAVLRPLGERGSPGADWLTLQNPARSLPDPVLPDIKGFVETPLPPDPLAETLAAGAGYEITADEVTKLDVTGLKVIFNKNVRLVSPQFHLTSQQLVVYLGKDKSTMRLAEAHGDVIVRLTGVAPEKACRGQSADATFDPGRDTLVLTGWPRVKGTSQEQVAADAATRMTLFTRTGRMLTDGPAQTRVSRSFMEQSTASPAQQPAR